MQMQNVACVLHCALDVVRDHNDGNTLAVELLNQLVHFVSDHRVQSGYWFVQKQKLTGGAQRPRQ